MKKTALFGMSLLSLVALSRLGCVSSEVEVPAGYNSGTVYDATDSLTDSFGSGFDSGLHEVGSNSDGAHNEGIDPRDVSASSDIRFLDSTDGDSSSVDGLLDGLVSDHYDTRDSITCSDPVYTGPPREDPLECLVEWRTPLLAVPASQHIVRIEMSETDQVWGQGDAEISEPILSTNVAPECHSLIERAASSEMYWGLRREQINIGGQEASVYRIQWGPIYADSGVLDDFVPQFGQYANGETGRCLEEDMLTGVMTLENADPECLALLLEGGVSEMNGKAYSPMAILAQYTEPGVFNEGDPVMYGVEFSVERCEESFE